MRSSCGVLGLLLFSVACEFQPIDVPPDPAPPTNPPSDSTSTPTTPSTPTSPTPAEPTAPTTPSTPQAPTPPAPSLLVDQCTDDHDCAAEQTCAHADDCFRVCVGSVCTSGCTGVCRGNDGRCAKTSMPAAANCMGPWSIPMTDQGCPQSPQCLCPDGTPRPDSGRCATACSCTPPRCGSGQAVVYRDGCCGSCAKACLGDDDCGTGQQCVRQGSCALVVCPKDARTCSDGRECYGVCMKAG
jgi:hypothetical protein